MSGAENVLYSFRATSDGRNPVAPLIDGNGVLYGTTPSGGIGDCLEPTGGSCGTVYSITTSGAEKVIYMFPYGGARGAVPRSGLMDVHGTLYGTTYYGGTSGPPQSGDGTVFSVTTDGTENVLHRFFWWWRIPHSGLGERGRQALWHRMVRHLLADPVMHVLAS
ncbi:MAG: choice-of-anchor tandem repeat GloVer-containing protein [Candidatus Cybelea sp.]